MSLLFFANIIALLFSFFVVGALLGTLFAKPGSPARATIVSTGRRLRALIFGWEFPPFNSGGLGVACQGIVRGLSDKNVDVTFVVPKRFPLSVPYARMLSAEDAVPEGVTVRVIESPITPYAESGSYARAEDGTPLYGSDLLAQTKRYARAGAAIAAREPHDVIYAHDWLAFGAGMAAKRVSKKPLIAHVHATEFARTGEGSINQDVYELERAGMHAADRVIAVSHRTKASAVARYGVPAEKVRVVWNGIDETTAPALTGTESGRLANLKKAGYKLVLFVGRLTVQKGPDHFLRAARLLAERDPHVLFIIAGSGDMEQQIMREAAAMGLADRVLFPGFVRGHDLAELYAAADLFVLPSVSEPFGITALEAMRAGVPVILSRQSGVAEAVPHALVADFWDAEKMADLMEQVLASPALHSDLATKGKQVAATLTWDRAAAGVKQIMEELVPAV